MDIIHISDTHGIHKIEIPKCDVLIHSGDIGSRTDIKELKLFLDWFSKQPAKIKLFTAGNHIIICANI